MDPSGHRLNSTRGVAEGPFEAKMLPGIPRRHRRRDPRSRNARVVGRACPSATKETGMSETSAGLQPADGRVCSHIVINAPVPRISPRDDNTVFGYSTAPLDFNTAGRSCTHPVEIFHSVFFFRHFCVFFPPFTSTMDSELTFFSHAVCLCTAKLVTRCMSNCGQTPAVPESD